MTVCRWPVPLSPGRDFGPGLGFAFSRGLPTNPVVGSYHHHGPCQHSDMTDRAGESVATRAWSRAVDSGGPHRTPQTPFLAVQASLRGFTGLRIGRWTPPGHPRGTCRPVCGLAWPRLGPGWALFRASPAPDPRRVPPDPVPAPRLVIPVTRPVRFVRAPMEAEAGRRAPRRSGCGAPCPVCEAGQVRCPCPRGGGCPCGARERERRVEDGGGDGGGAGRWGDCGRSRATVGASAAGLVGGGTPPRG